MKNNKTFIAAVVTSVISLASTPVFANTNPVTPVSKLSQETRILAVEKKSHNNEGRIKITNYNLNKLNKQLEINSETSNSNTTHINEIWVANQLNSGKTNAQRDDIKTIKSTIKNDQKKIDSNHNEVIKHHKRLASNEKKVSDNKNDIIAQGDRLIENSVAIRHNTSIINRSNVEKSNQFNKNITYNNTAIHENTAAINNNSAAIDNNTADISRLRVDFNEYKKQTDTAFAAMAAMNNIPVVDDKNLSIGAGVGYYYGQSAVSVGGNYNISDSLVVKTSVAGNPNQWHPIIGAGVAYGF